MDIRELLFACLIPLFFVFLVLLAKEFQTIPDRYPQGHDLGHGCVAIELGGFPYKLCPLNP